MTDIADISAALDAFEASPSDATEPGLRAARRALLSSLIESPSQTLERLGVDDGQRLIQRMLKSGLRCRPPEQDAISLLSQLTPSLSEVGDRLAAAIVGFCFVYPSHMFRTPPRIEAVPFAHMGLVFRCIGAMPEFLVGTDEADRHCVFLEKYLDCVLALVGRNDIRPEVRAKIASYATVLTEYMTCYFSRRNLRPIMEKRAQIAEMWIEGAGGQLDFEFTPSGRARPKIGIFRPLWDNSPESASMAAHVEALDEVADLVFYVETKTDLGFLRLSRPPTIVSASGVGEWVRTIRSDDLDALILGTNVTGGFSGSYLLSAFRLARVQIVTTLCPATTGFSRSDIYLTGAFNEPENGQAHYREKLVIVPQSINVYRDIWPSTASGPAERSAYGFAADDIIYISGANIYKLNPELLDCWAQIITRVENSVLALYPFNPHWSGRYAGHFFTAFVHDVFRRHGIAADRIRILPAVKDRGEVKRRLSAANIYLDSFPFSGAVSILDPLEAGLPMVLMCDQTARGRQSAAMHMHFGLPAEAAHDRGTYAAKAIELGNSIGRRQELIARSEDSLRKIRSGKIDMSPMLTRLKQRKLTK